MKNTKNYISKLFYSVLIFFGLINSASGEMTDNPNIVIMEIKYGTVIIELYPNKAPNHVARIKQLTNQGFYNGLPFHRVIADFMVQTGDPNGDGTGGSSLPNLKAEFNDIKHVRGVVSMARAADPNSANSQFFIMLGDAPSLDGQYSAFGRVISGMEYVDKIKKGDPYNNGIVSDPDVIISMKVGGITNDSSDIKATAGNKETESAPIPVMSNSSNASSN